MLKKYLMALCLSSCALFAQNNARQDITKAPDGVTIKLTSDGGFQIFSVATGTYDIDDVDDILSAQNEATLKAKANLAKFITESLKTDEQLDNQAEKIKEITSVDGKTSTKIDKKTSKKLLLNIKNNSDALLKGVIILDTAKIPGSGSSGTYKVRVGVSSKTLFAADKLIQNLPKEETAANSQPAFHGTAIINQSTTINATAIAVTEKNKNPQQTPLPQGWVECVGEGKTRQAAIYAALIEGIQQVYGLSLKYSSTLKERISKFRSNVKKTNESSKKSHIDTLTETEGFVKEFRIIKETQINSQIIKVVIHAHIVKSTNIGSLMIYKPNMSLDKLTKYYDIGPEKRISGSDLSALAGETISTTFINQNKHLVYTPEDIKKAIIQQKSNKKLVDNNLSPNSELLKLGKIISADYILTSEIKDFKYSRKIILDKKLNKFVPQYKMSISLFYKITNVNTGNSISAKEITVSLTNNEITTILTNDEDCNLLKILLSKVAMEISKII